MALHTDFPNSPYVILKPDIRWFPADEALRESSYEKLLPPLVHELRKNVMVWRSSSYSQADLVFEKKFFFSGPPDNSVL